MSSDDSRRCDSGRASFPLKPPTDLSFIDFIDALITNASSYKPEIVYDSASMLLDNSSFLVWPHLKIYESSPYTPEFTSDSFKAFNSPVLSIQMKINVDQATGQGYFTNTTIATTYNSKIYSINLDKSSIKRYMEQNGYETSLRLIKKKT